MSKGRKKLSDVNLSFDREALASSQIFNEKKWFHRFYCYLQRVLSSCSVWFNYITNAFRVRSVITHTEMVKDWITNFGLQFIDEYTDFQSGFDYLR